MASDSTKGQAAPPKDANQLAAMRTIMSTDRTLMAWIRTSLAMLSFGFTIYKVLQGFQEVEHIRNNAPRDAGLLLIGLGVLSIIMGTIEYWYTLKELNQEKRFTFRRPTLIIATIISVGGLLMFLSIISRML